MTQEGEHRAWHWRLSNYTDEHINKIQKIRCSYLIYGKEISPTTGTPHLQGYIYFTSATTFKRLQKKFPRGTELLIAKGSAQQNLTYISKEDKNPFIKGDMPRQGERTDLNEVKNEIISGKKVDDLALEKPAMYHQYARTLHKIEDLRMRKTFRQHMTEGLWLWGPTGSGKSELAFKDFTPETHYVWKYENNNWQDGYTQQDIVIVDEFRGQIKFSDILMMVDKHPNFYVSRRGREPLPFTSKKVIFTSSMPPDEVFKNLSNNDKFDQFMRRIKVEYLGKNT